MSNCPRFDGAHCCSYATPCPEPLAYVISINNIDGRESKVLHGRCESCFDNYNRGNQSVIVHADLRPSVADDTGNWEVTTDADGNVVVVDTTKQWVLDV